MDYAEKRNLPNSTFCFPLFIDDYPVSAGSKHQRQVVKTNWAETSRYMETILNETTNFTGIPTCSHSQNQNARRKTPERLDLVTKLVDETGGNNTYGRLEVKLNGVWGTVCHHRWSTKNSAVACQMLGISSTS